MRNRSVFRVIISKSIGIVVFAFVVLLANYLIPYIGNSTYAQIIGFINRNFFFLLVLSFIFGFGEMFFALPFPFDLPGPLFTSVASVLLVTFIGRILRFVGGITDADIISAYNIVSYIAYPLVFFMVFIGGYIMIFSDLFNSGNVHKKKPHKEKYKATKTWDDVGEEFKNTLFDFFAMLRRSFNKK